jgi:hypothetical protein
MAIWECPGQNAFSKNNIQAEISVNNKIQNAAPLHTEEEFIKRVVLKILIINQWIHSLSCNARMQGLVFLFLVLHFRDAITGIFVGNDYCGNVTPETFRNPKKVSGPLSRKKKFPRKVSGPDRKVSGPDRKVDRKVVFFVF